MIFNEISIMDEVGCATFSSLRENQGGVEFLQPNGEWKSLISHYNPSFFANLFVENNFEESDDYFLYGIGDGQIILEIIERELSGEFYILETNMDILRFAHESFQILTHVQGISNIHFCGSAQMETVKSFLQSLPNDLPVRYYYPEISAIPQEFSFLSEWLNNRMIDYNSGEKHNNEIEYNVEFNDKKNLPDFLALFRGRFVGKPVLILLAGPSLADVLSLITEVQDRYFLISVGRNGNLCREYGIKPDLWVELDPAHQPKLWSRLKDNDISAPLVIMDSTSYLVHDFFKGTIAMVRSKVNSWDEDALKTGKSTVAAFAMDLALEMGLGPVVLAGQDLCYINGKSHVNATHVEEGKYFTKSTPKLLCNDGEKRYTSKAFLRHKESIQSVVLSHSEDCFTLSAKGAVIEGVAYCSAEGFISLVDRDIGKEDIKKDLFDTLSRG